MLSIVAFVEHELIELASSSSSMYALVPWLAFHPVSYWLRPNTSSNSNNRLRSLSLNFGRFPLLRLTAQGLELDTGLGCCLFVMKPFQTKPAGPTDFSSKIESKRSDRAQNRGITIMILYQPLIVGMARETMASTKQLFDHSGYSHLLSDSWVGSKTTRLIFLKIFSI